VSWIEFEQLRVEIGGLLDFSETERENAADLFCASCAFLRPMAF
jgi:hypothetical protein